MSDERRAREFEAWSEAQPKRLAEPRPERGARKTMTDDYLWDGSGAPDPEVERLERVLGRLGWREQSRLWPAAQVRPPLVAVRRWLGVAALAGCLALGVVAWLEGRSALPRAEATATASVDARATRASSDAGLVDGSK